MFKKQEYLDQLDQKLEQYTFNIEVLKKDLENASDEIKEQYEEHIVNLRKQIAVIKELQSLLINAEDSALEGLKAKLDGLGEDLNATFEGIKDWVKSKIL